MTSLADEVKALIAMGIPPTEALAAVTADRERQGKGSAPQKKEGLPDSTSALSSPPKSTTPLKNGKSGGGGSSSSRSDTTRPLSYNRPGMIKHTQNDGIDILPGMWPSADCLVSFCTISVMDVHLL